jgi:hypothetical protein
MMRRPWLLAIAALAGAACGAPIAAPSSPTAATSPAPAASSSPLGAPADTGAYACADSSGGGTARAGVTTIRAGAATGYDRFVVEFDGPVPGYQVTRQPSAVFTQDASGKQVVLDGASGVLVRLAPASNGPGAPLAISPRAAVLREVRNVGDFEGVVRWGLGLASPACMHVFTLDSPSRLVIDFKS